MRILYFSAHGILEYDALQLLTDLGHEVFSLGAYFRPDAPMDPKRPPLALPRHAVLEAAVEALGTTDNLEAARRRLPDALLDWADVIEADAYPVDWLAGQWDRIKHKRVIWRTIGQSNPDMERAMRACRKEGMQVVRYSPAEQRYFEPLGAWAGADALIRFYKKAEEWDGWTGASGEVGQVSQHADEPHGRDAFTNWKWFEAATLGLPHSFAGSNSEKIGGKGFLGYDAMREYLRGLRAYCYTGTIPASYTLGFIEAAMMGIPIVSITRRYMWAGPAMFEADELANWAFDDPTTAREKLRALLVEPDLDAHRVMRERAISLFGYATIRAQWEAFLG